MIELLIDVDVQEDRLEEFREVLEYTLDGGEKPETLPDHIFFDKYGTLVDEKKSKGARTITQNKVYIHALLSGGKEAMKMAHMFIDWMGDLITFPEGRRFMGHIRVVGGFPILLCLDDKREINCVDTGTLLKCDHPILLNPRTGSGIIVPTPDEFQKAILNSVKEAMDEIKVPCGPCEDPCDDPCDGVKIPEHLKN